MNSVPKKKRRSAAAPSIAAEAPKEAVSDTFRQLAEALDVGTLGPAAALAVAVQTRPRGRPSHYNEDIALDICAELAAGHSIDQIGEMDGMPCARTIRRWQAAHEEFQEKVSAGMRAGLENLLHHALAVSRFDDSTDPADKRLKIETDFAVFDRLKAPVMQRDDMIAGRHSGDDAKLVEGEVIEADPFSGPLKEWERQSGIKSKALAPPEPVKPDQAPAAAQ